MSEKSKREIKGALKDLNRPKRTYRKGAGKRESDVERRLRERVHKSGGLCLKFVSPGTAGVPDRIVIAPGGKVIFVELKREDGRLSPSQKVIQKKMTDHGCEIYNLYGDIDVDAFMREVFGNG